MRNFAKASIVKLVVHQLKQTNPELVPKDADSVDALRRAHVPIKYKREILDTVWREAGPETLLSIGQGIRSAGYDPLWHAAVRSASPALFFDKWRRFEVFAHSQNRLRINHSTENAASFERYAVRCGTPTTPENLLICGLIIALLEACGCFGLRCEMALNNGAAYCIRENGRFAVPGDADALRTDTWSIEWRRFSAKPESAVSELNPQDIELPWSRGSAARKSIESVVRILLLDIAHQWKVGDLARAAGLSTRSLQRKLSQAELSFSHLVRLVRIHEACRLLKNSDAPITTIGFCAGFSDSSHFSRDFRAGMGMTPSDYRTAFQGV